MTDINLHRSLLRQIEKYGGNIDTASDEYKKLLQVISETYTGFDEDRGLMERSLEISSRELTEQASLLKDALDASKNAQKKLFESEVFLSELINVIPLPLFYKDTKGRYLGVNKAYEEFFGERKENLMGKTMFDVYPLELAEIYHTQDIELLEKGGVQQFETQIEDDHDVVRDVIFNKAVFTDVQGSISGLIGVIFDVTERKKEEAKLQQTQEVVENSQDAIFSASLKGDILSWNGGAKKIFKYSTEEIVGKSASILFTPERIDNLAFFIGEIKQNKQVSNFEAPAVRKDGSMVDISLSISPVVEHDDKVSFASVIARDITERKKAELEIQEKNKKILIEKNKVDAIIRSIGDGLFVVDKDFKVTIVNDVAIKMAGFSEEEIVGKTYTEKLKFVIENTGKTNDQFIKDAMLGKAIQQMTDHTFLVAKDGSKTHVANIAAPLVDHDGEVVGCVVVFRDITKERQIDTVKTEFVSLASHQLRTPLSTMSWYAEMLLAGDAGVLNKEQNDFVDEIQKGIERMTELVKALLDVSRLELGTFMVEPEPTDIIELIRSVVAEQQPQIDAKKISLATVFGDNIPIMQIDQKLFRIVVQNLLSNATKYSPEGGAINMSLSVDENYLFFRISDTGYGIPREQQYRIFSKLFRADNVREKKTEGTGLGLYIVKSIIDQSGGNVWFESPSSLAFGGDMARNEDTQGTTFYFELPLSGMAKKEGTKALG